MNHEERIMQAKKIRLMKKGLLLGAIYANILVYLLIQIAYHGK